MKDRHAGTNQGFSVQMAGQEGPDWSLLGNPFIEIIKTTRHSKKLKKGSIKLNKFELVVSQLNVDKIELETLIKRV